MADLTPTGKKLAVGLGILIGLGAIYYSARKKKPLPEAVKQTVTAPVQTTQSMAKAAMQTASTVASTPLKFLKGSKEAKEHMAKLREMSKAALAARSKGGKATAAKGPHKGHKTKRGLRQDQQRTSKQPFEKSYRKKKAAPVTP